MKAVRIHQFGGPTVLRYEEAPTPEPASDQILIRVHAAGINPVDTYIRAGRYGSLPSLPYIPGSDGAGQVREVAPRGSPHAQLKFGECREAAPS